MRDSERLEAVLRFGFPVIIIEHHSSNIPDLVHLVTDSHTIGRLAGDHLMHCGFKNFAYCGFDNKPWSVARCLSFNKLITSAGYSCSVYKHPFSPKSITWEKEQKYMVEWLKALPTPIGLMTCNDDRSQQVLQACKLADLKVPEEISIIGVDNDELICNLSDPPLSSVSINFERAGYEAAAALDQMMKGQIVDKTEILVHPTHIVQRQSTDITAINDQEVARAVNYIRNQAKENLGVENVVRVTALSRRILEKRFRKFLGRTILDEIHRVRTNQIAQMLVETNLSILEIAMTFGFQGTEHIARYFHKEKGMNLINYRMQYGRK